MSYLCVKRIKGNLYLYRQTSTRIGEKVHSRSEYIGPVSGSGFFRSVNPRTGHRPADGELQISKSVREKFSTTGVAKDHDHIRSAAGRVGVTDIGKVRIAYGISSGVKRSRSGFSASLPYGSSNSRKLRDGCRKASAAAYLQAVSRQRPDVASRIEEQFDRSMRSTRAAVRSYLVHTNDKSSFVRALAMSWFGSVSRVKNVRPEMLGLTGYGRTRDWREEFVNTVAWSQSQGGTRSALKRTQAQLAIAEQAVKKAALDRSMWGGRKRRAVKRAQARVDGQKEMLRRLRYLEGLGI